MKTILELTRRFAVALSFPGEARQRVAAIAEYLSGHLGRERVLYDKFHEAEFARPNLDVYLQNLYHEHAALNVVFLCEDYEKKEWCGLEWRAIRISLNSADKRSTSLRQRWWQTRCRSWRDRNQPDS
jgi:hypothetical protein